MKDSIGEGAGKKVLVFGEVLLRLSPPGHLRLRQASALEVYLGGAELNVAAALACLGVEAAVLTALPENQLGWLAWEGMRKAGVGTEKVMWRREGRMGLYFYEAGSHPRQGLVVYDRACSAASMLEPGEVDWERELEDCHLFHTTGITAAISEGCRELMLQGLEEARRAGVPTSFDLNYRSQLWGREEARRGLEPALELAEHLILSDADCRLILGMEGTDEEELARRVMERYGGRSVALTLRRDLGVERGRFQALSWDGKRARRGRDFQLNYVDRVGGGDAFAAGYIYGVLRDDLSLGLELGSAMYALKCTIPGDMLHCSARELEELLGGRGEAPPIRR